MDLIGTRRRMLMREIGGIPGAYKRIEYLESSGSQYINSGIECTGDLAVEFSFMYFDVNNTAICGGINTQDAPTYFRHHCTPQQNVRYWIQRNSIPTSSVITNSTGTNQKHVLRIDPINGAWECDGNNGTFTPMEAGLTTGQSYGILGRIANTGAIQCKPSRCYWFKFYRNGCILGDFAPCIRKSDNKPGMYDTVTKQFFTNAGSGEFIVPA